MVSPLRRRGYVGLKEIGTEHEYFPDIFLCACLGTPGIFYAIVAVEDPLWLRIVIAIENAIIGLVSVIADGCLYTMGKARDHARLWHIGIVVTSFVAFAPKFG